MQGTYSLLSSHISPSMHINGVKSAKFDYNKNDFRALFYDSFGVSSSKELDSYLLNTSIQKIRESGYKAIRSNEFAKIFRRLLGDLYLSFGKIYHQAFPTLRVHLPGQKSEYFHNDDISSGHPSKLINLWIPLTKTNFHNSLHFVPRDSSLSLRNEFLYSHRSIKWLDRESRKYSAPVLADYGDIVIFDNSVLHGTLTNHSLKPRISIDFRIVSDNSHVNLNRKKHNIDYFVFEPGPVSTTRAVLTSATSVVLCANDASHLTHSVQRALIDNFASQNGFEVTYEVSEWQSNNFPMIKHILDEKPDMPVLLSSRNSFSVSGSFIPSFESLLPRLMCHPGGVYFCFEGVKVT